MDPVKARENFGDGYNFSPGGAAPAANPAAAALAAAAAGAVRPPGVNPAALLRPPAAGAPAALRPPGVAPAAGASPGAPNAAALAQLLLSQGGAAAAALLSQGGAAAAAALLQQQAAAAAKAAAAAPPAPGTIELPERTLARLSPGTAKFLIVEHLMRVGAKVGTLGCLLKGLLPALLGCKPSSWAGASTSSGVRGPLPCLHGSAAGGHAHGSMRCRLLEYGPAGGEGPGN